MYFGTSTVLSSPFSHTRSMLPSTSSTVLHAGIVSGNGYSPWSAAYFVIAALRRMTSACCLRSSASSRASRHPSPPSITRIAMMTMTTISSIMVNPSRLCIS